MIAVRPCGITVARMGVARLHRHLRVPPPSGLVAFELVANRWPVGWGIVGRPNSQVLQGRGWVEVTRIATDGVRNGCSMLYGAAARWAWRAGSPVLTYTRIDEPGTSLRAAGWVEIGRTATRPGGRSWSRKGRVRAPAAAERIGKVRWIPGRLFGELAKAIAACCVVRP